MISRASSWEGLGNYLNLFNDPLFGRTVKNTFYFFILKVPIQMFAALLLAILVRQPFRGVGLLRTVILIPTITSMVVVSIIWGLMYHPNNGLINGILEVLKLPTQNFLIDTKQAMPSLVLMTIWKDVGFNMIFFLAGLMGIPSEYYEAARIDGANTWKLFRHITLPLLRGTTVFVLVTSMISAFKVFTPVFIMTKGGPASVTRVLVLYIYENAFIFNNMGYAAALSVILALFLLAASMIQMSLSRESR
jgi:multiple sugar transport system permease protein